MKANLVLFVALAVFGAQVTGHPTAIKQEEDVASLLDTLKDILEQIQNNEHIDLDGILGSYFDLEEVLAILEALQSDEEGSPQEIECILNVVQQSEAEVQEAAFEFLLEAINLGRLLIKQAEEYAACDAIGGANPSAVNLAQRHVCRLQVQATTGIEITVAQIKVRVAFAKIRTIWIPVYSCVNHLLD